MMRVSLRQVRNGGRWGATGRLSVAALLLASCGDPMAPYKAAEAFRVKPRAPKFRSLIGKAAPEVELPDQYASWRAIPPRGRACVVFFADRHLVDFLARWKDALRASYPDLPVRWVVRRTSRGGLLKAARLLPAGVRLHADVEREFESGWGVELRGVYVFAVDAEGVVRAAVRGPRTFEKMEKLFSAIDDFAK